MQWVSDFSNLTRSRKIWVQFETSVATSLHQVQRMFVNFTEYDIENVPDLYRSEATIKDWLDKQEEGSVIYVAFGAKTKPNQDELNELALGLELSRLPFIWAIRKQRGLADPEPTELPEGFEERTRGHGLVYTTWVPQTKILSHDSVGGLLIHSGWSSVIEAVQFGRALILLPLLADQGLIAKLVEEKKLGYLIPRNERDGWFSRDSVAESVRLVMVEEEGKIYRTNVKEMKRVFGDMDKQDKYVDNLLYYLESHKILKK